MKKIKAGVKTIKEPKVKKEKVKVIVNPLLTDGLNQKIIDSKGKPIPLKAILKEGDWWEMKSRGSVMYILTHNAIKKIADLAGITTVDYSMLTQPTHENNYQMTMKVIIADPNGKQTIELGESNRNNLGPRGRNNPANMAQKRAWDRAVLRHLGIVGFLGEDELQDKEEEKMENLNPDEAKQIVDLLNEIFAAKTKEELEGFSTKMVDIKASGTYSESQLEVLRTAWSNQMIKFNKTF